MTSTVASPTEFYICCASSYEGTGYPCNHYVAWDATNSKFAPTSSKLTTDYSTAAKFIVIATETAGQYKIYCTTNSKYVTYANTDKGQSKVITADTEAEAKNWKIISNLGGAASKFVTSSLYDIVPADIASPANSSPSWNFHGGLNSSNLGFYDANDASSVWTFVALTTPAKNFTPAEGAAYYIDPVQGEKNLASFFNGYGTSFGLNGTTSESHLGNVFKVTAVDYAGGECLYNIQPYYLSTGETPAYVRFTEAVNGDAKVTVSTNTANNKWRIIVSSTSGQYTIRPAGGAQELSWNIRGTNSLGEEAIGFWTGYWGVEDENNRWEFVSVDINDASTLSGLVSRYQNKLVTLTDAKMTGYGVSSTTDQLGVPTWATYSTYRSSLTAENADAATIMALDFSSLETKKFTSADNGVYTIKNKILNKYLFHKPDTKDLTLINDGAETLTQNYYFNLTFNDEGQITSAKNVVYDVDMAKGAQGNNFAGATAQAYVTAEAPVSPTDAKDDNGLYSGANYFVLPGFHSTAQNVYTVTGGSFNTTTNPYFVTTWNTTGSANQYLFEKVSLEEGAQLYTVNINYNDGYTEEQVGARRALYGTVELTNPSYLYFATAPEQSVFTPADATSFAINGYSVSGNAVNISYDVTLIGETERQAAQTLLDNTEGKVGYPAEAPRAAFKTTVFDDATVTATQYANALATFKASTDVVTPEPGKTYTISFRRTADDAAHYYIYRETEAGTTLKFAARPAEGELPESAKFVCLKHDDGKYSFVPVKGGFLKYNGLTTAYTETNSINKATFKPLVDPSLSRGNITDTSAENLFGYVCLTFVGRSTSSARSGCMIIQENNEVSNMTFGESDAPFLNGSFTSALLIEEVDYANHPTLLEIKGDKVTGKGANTHIGTFSAPFETTIPDGVTAYYAESDPVSNALVLTEITTGTIPANEGVFLLAATATPGYFVPATTTTTLATENKLLNSAGTPHTIVANDYVLANANNVTAIYNATTGTTLAMNKAYLNLTPAEASRFSLSFDGSTTAIDAINAEPNNENGNIYDLSGRRVRQATKGIYVIGNKKVIVK